MSSTFDRFQENLSSIKSPIEIISLLIKKIEENNSKCHIILNKSVKALIVFGIFYMANKNVTLAILLSVCCFFEE